jgi:hypothetical protein
LSREESHNRAIAPSSLFPYRSGNPNGGQLFPKSMAQIETLTPEQTALIPIYREKWRKIALSTEPIEQEGAIEAVKKVYALIGLNEPDQIIFCDSPQAAMWDVLRWCLRRKVQKHLKHQLDDPLKNKLICQFLPNLLENLKYQTNKNIVKYPESELYTELSPYIGLSKDILLNLNVPIINYLRDWLK